MNFVPAEFFRQFLADLGKPTVYSVKDTSHWRAPIFHTSTRRISFKIFEMKAIRSALPEIQIAQAWCRNRTISEDDEIELDDIKTAEDAIHAAVKRARTTRRRVSCRSQLNVSSPSREFEVIWWPDMYETSGYGKMSLRYYVGKVFHS